MKLFLLFVVLVFAIFGLGEFLHNLKLMLIFPKRKMQSSMVVILNEKTALQQIQFVGEQYKWLGTKFADRVIVVCENFSADLVEECKNISNKYDIKLVVKGRL